MKLKNKIMTAVLALGLSTSVFAGSLEVNGDQSSLGGALSDRSSADLLNASDYDFQLNMLVILASDWKVTVQDRASNAVLGAAADTVAAAAIAHDGTNSAAANLFASILDLGSGTAVASAADSDAFCSRTDVVEALGLAGATGTITGIECRGVSESLNGLQADSTTGSNTVEIVMPLQAVYEVNGGMTLDISPRLGSSTAAGFRYVSITNATDEDVLCDEVANGAGDCDSAGAYQVSSVFSSVNSANAASTTDDFEIRVRFDMGGANFKENMANEVELFVEAAYL